MVKSIYGLKQAPKDWHEDFKSKIVSNGFNVSSADPCLFIRVNEDGVSGLTTWVDDNMVFGSEKARLEIKNLLESKYKIRDFGKVSFFCGLEIDYLSDGVKIHQTAYSTAMLQKFELMNLKVIDSPQVDSEKGNSNANVKFNDVNRYRQLVGSLRYLVTVSRPDIAFALYYVSRNLQSPSVLDYLNVINIFRYLKGTTSFGIKYLKNMSELVGYSDASYAEDYVDRKSVSGYVFMVNGGAVSWSSKKQRVVALSSTEAEYIALCRAGQEGCWIRKIEEDLKVDDHDLIIHEDNTSTICLTQNHSVSERTKHIAVKYHFIRDLVKDRVVTVVHIPTDKQVADVLTKSLSYVLHNRHCSAMGMTK